MGGNRFWGGGVSLPRGGRVQQGTVLRPSRPALFSGAASFAPYYEPAAGVGSTPRPSCRPVFRGAGFSFPRLPEPGAQRGRLLRPRARANFRGGRGRLSASLTASGGGGFSSARRPPANKFFGEGRLLPARLPRSNRASKTEEAATVASSPGESQPPAPPLNLPPPVFPIEGAL